MKPKTLYEKHIDSHSVRALDDKGHVLLYIDRQVINEYTSPQAFSGLREANRRVWRPETSLAVVDHVNPTTPLRTRQMPEGRVRCPIWQKTAPNLASSCLIFSISVRASNMWWHRNRALFCPAW